MKIEAETLDRWAEQASGANERLTGTMYRLQREHLTPEAAHACLSDVQAAHSLTNRLLQSLLASGAADPRAHAETYRARREAVPMATLSSDANRRLATALRTSCNLAKQVEDERGLTGDSRYLSDMLDIFATATEGEAFGPVGLGEGG